MTSDVSRRDFVALAGAGVAVAGCAQKAIKENSALSAFRNKPFGPPPPYGMPANSQKPNGAASTLSFRPEFLSVVYFKIGRNPSDKALVARHGYASIPTGSSEMDIQQIAEAELHEAKTTNPGAWRRANNPANSKFRREEDLTDFDFGSQNKIFIMIDHDKTDIRFDTRPKKGTSPPQLSNLVSFSPVLAQIGETEIDYNMIAQPNNSFMNAKIINSTKFPNREVLVLENWYTDLNGDTITGIPKLKYSMNINLLVRSEGGRWLPMIIDPDTGNGMGNSP